MLPSKVRTIKLMIAAALAIPTIALVLAIAKQAESSPVENTEPVEKAEPANPQTCNGQPFSGDYMAKQRPTIIPLSAEVFNVAAGKSLVKDISTLSGQWVLMTPKDSSMDCESFMDEVKETGMFESIEPNYIVRIQPF